MDNRELYKLWDEFLDSWPAERVINMTLEEYTGAGNPDAFIHWVEFRTKSLGTISGSSSFIFGIYSRKDQSYKKNTKNHFYEDKYAWRAAYGETKEQAFTHVKAEIIKVIEAVKNNQFHLINDVDLITTVKWKIAFLYQNRENIKILPTFAEQRLRFLTGVDKKGKEFKIEVAYAQLLEQKGEKELFEYNNELTQKYLEANPKERFNTQIAYDYMHERYPTFEKTAEYLFCIENKFGLELALETTNFDKTSPRLFLKPTSPLDIQGIQVSPIAKGKSPNSNLESTKTLIRDNEFVQVTITSMQQLEALCNWWDKLEENSQESSKTSKGEVSQMEVQKQPLNRILFGAAGTGKTFHSINHALAVIENESLEVLEQEDRTALKARFDQYKEQGQIKFVTFHQSFSYEDFVEGIRAETNDVGKLTYDVKPGVFKEICSIAKLSSNKILLDAGNSFKRSINDAINSLIAKVQKAEVTFYTKRNVEFKVYGNENGTMYAITSGVQRVSLSKKYIYGYLENPSDEILDQKSYEWAIAYSLRSGINYEGVQRKKKPYILIIDEINRGNISRIFGELITLIEDSKRQGADEELSVILPYSKEEFSVPSNVYIVGTMNSSDRSLTGLDIALRRRFTFIEMPPKPELLNDIEVEGLNIGELLKVINQRIEVLLDRDHCIGHANFMSLKKHSTLEHLTSIFKQKIIPQLQEYFFDDWARINLVFFNNGMLIEDNTLKINRLFPSNFEQELGCSDEKKIWKINNKAFESIDAFVSILGSQG